MSSHQDRRASLRGPGVSDTHPPVLPAPGGHISSGDVASAETQERRNMVVHPLSMKPFGLTALASSGPIALRHPEKTTYRCFLPDLTGFIALRRVGSGPQRRSA